MQYIVIAEQQELLRIGLIHSLKSSNINVCADSFDFNSLTTTLNTQQCDLLLVDYNIFSDSRHDELQLLKESNIHMKIIITATKGSYYNFYLLLQKGDIDGLCLKSDDSHTFKQAVKKVINNENFVSETLLNSIEKQNTKLTPKELKVIELLVLGLNNKEVAQNLNNSERTINVHRSNIMSKLHLSNVVELINYTYQHGMSKLNFSH
jgi:DNA-binding NarL/FixJ family response regulator